MSTVTLLFCQLLKVPYNWASSQLVNDLLPWFSSSSCVPSLCSLNHWWLPALRGPEVAQVYGDPPGHRSAAQRTMNERAALSRRWIVGWSRSEEVLRVCEAVPVQRRSRENVSIWGTEWERNEAKHKRYSCFSYFLIVLESVGLLWDSLDGGIVSPSLSSSLPPSVWSKETLSRALLRRCISSSPWGDEKLRAAMVDRTIALCLLWLSPPPSRCPLWL